MVLSSRAITIAILGLDNAGKFSETWKEKSLMRFLFYFLGKTTTTRVLEKGNDILPRMLMMFYGFDKICSSRGFCRTNDWLFSDRSYAQKREN